ncbi:MAG TPA: sigma-70 family RNA polymerase sigma factor [Actinomycetota bacterium]|nr:sigma-70 family RNA polymerase sigma factor [Actinomycetota bacterium]
MWSLSDEALLAGFAAREPEASTAFVRRFQHRLFGLALTILGDAKAAEEAAQEAFVRAWRHADAFDARKGAVATWLLTIARNASLDMARVRLPVPIDPDAIFASDHAEQEGPSVEDTMRVRDALGRIPSEQRRAIVLSAFYGRTAAEIAEMDRLPLGTVKTRIRSGMAKLKDLLEVTND